jgi:hypothetical protein
MTNAPRILATVVATSLVIGPLVASEMQTKANVCGLLPKAEVKKLIGATDAFDRVEPAEVPTKTGSSCRYADLLVMVHEGDFDGVRKGAARFEALSGVGQEAYLFNNPAGGVELFASVGSGRLLTLSRRVDAASTAAAARPGVIALAKALVARLQ